MFQESEDASLDDGEIIYDLKSSVAHIQDYNSPGNLVAMISVEKSYHNEPVVSEGTLNVGDILERMLGLKAVFQLRVFHTYIHARKALNPFQYYT